MIESHAVSLAALIPILLALAFVMAGIAGSIVWIWMLIDCATREPSEGNDKLTWILVIVLASWIGALIYLFVRRPVRIRQYGR